jgi:hypothetical protein
MRGLVTIASLAIAFTACASSNQVRTPLPVHRRDLAGAPEGGNGATIVFSGPSWSGVNKSGSRRVQTGPGDHETYQEQMASEQAAMEKARIIATNTGNPVMVVIPATSNSPPRVELVTPFPTGDR